MAKKKKSKPIIPILVVVIALFLIFFIPWYTGRVTLYEDEHTTGNTSGNLLNGGLFCEDDGKIYFSNIKDNGTLYVMDSDLSNKKKLYDDNVSYINAAGKYIFYTRRNDKKGAAGDVFLSFSSVGLYRINKSGNDLEQYYNQPTQAAALYGNNIFYQHYSNENQLELFRVKIDNTKNERLLKQAVSPCSIYNDRIYYSNIDENHHICSMTLSGSSATIYEGNATNVLYADGFIYFLDMNRDYALTRINADGSDPVLLADKRICAYNISKDGQSVYYQVDNATDENGLYRLNLSNGESTLLMNGDFNYIHVLQDYVFFMNYDMSECYVMDANGNIKDF